MKSKYVLRLIVLVGVMFIAAACRRQAEEGGPASLPTLTPTPRSTPLPALPTAIPIGQEGNPLQMIIHPPGDIDDARDAADDFEAAILEQSGLVVQVELVERDAEALAALCDSSSGQVAVAWLNGLSYLAAQAQNCGQPMLQVERGARQDARTGEAASIIAEEGGSVTTYSSLRGKNFCRISYDDLYSWLVPSLMMRANGVDPLALETVADYETIPELVQAVAEGDCDAAGIPAEALDEFADEIGDAAGNVTVLDTSVEFPLAILVVPLQVPLGTRLTLNDTLETLAENSTTSVRMRPLLGQNALLAVTTDDFVTIADFISSTGLDFSQLGN